MAKSSNSSANASLLDQAGWLKLSLSIGALFLYTLSVAVWRVYLSPLAKIPGPKLAALTGWYETYLELVKDGGGRFLFEYRKWHEQYGN